MAQEVKKPEQKTQPLGWPRDIFSELRGEMDHLFDSFAGRSRGIFPTLFGTNDAPAIHVDVKEDEKAITIEAEIPGMEEKDVNVALRDGVLTVKGEKKSEREEEKDNYHMTERSYGSFSRSFRVPDVIDNEKVSAHVTKGVLKVVLPKKEGAVKPGRQIPISKT